MSHIPRAFCLWPSHQPLHMGATAEFRAATWPEIEVVVCCTAKIVKVDILAIFVYYILKGIDPALVYPVIEFYAWAYCLWWQNRSWGAQPRYCPPPPNRNAHMKVCVVVCPICTGALVKGHAGLSSQLGCHIEDLTLSGHFLLGGGAATGAGLEARARLNWSISSTSAHVILPCSNRWSHTAWNAWTGSQPYSSESHMSSCRWRAKRWLMASFLAMITNIYPLMIEQAMEMLLYTAGWPATVYRPPYEAR